MKKAENKEQPKTVTRDPELWEYPHIPLGTNQSIHQQSRSGLSGRPYLSFVALEKLHGAHLSILVKKGKKSEFKVQAACRSSLLHPEDDFFGYQAVLAKCTPLAFELFRILAAKDATPWRLQIHGELVGGYYPCEGVEAVEGVEPVQRRVHYCPDLEFVALDVRVDGRMLDWEDADQYLSDAGFRRAPVLARGDLQAVLKLPVEYPTWFPSSLGLPPIDGNLAEGIVIRPTRYSEFLPFAWKLKCPRFSEVVPPAPLFPSLSSPCDVLYHPLSCFPFFFFFLFCITPSPRLSLLAGAIPSRGHFLLTRILSRAQVVPIPQINAYASPIRIIETLEPVTRGYINANRLASIVSWQPPIPRKDSGKLLHLLIRDVFEEIERESPHYKSLDGEAKKELLQRVKGDAIKLVVE